MPASRPFVHQLRRDQIPESTHNIGQNVTPVRRPTADRRGGEAGEADCRLTARIITCIVHQSLADVRLRSRSGTVNTSA